MSTADCQNPAPAHQYECIRPASQKQAEITREAARTAAEKTARQAAFPVSKSAAAHPGRIIGAPPADCTGISEIPTNECNTLLALYNNTHGNNWDNNNGWNTTTPCSTPWYGITCASGHVSQIGLSYNYLTGILPDLSALTAVTQIDLSSNNLGSVVPPLPPSLKSLNLGNNVLAGNFPTTLPPSLVSLDLSSNNFVGSILALTYFVSATYINLSGDVFSGGIPDMRTIRCYSVSQGILAWRATGAARATIAQGFTGPATARST